MSACRLLLYCVLCESKKYIGLLFRVLSPDANVSAPGSSASVVSRRENPVAPRYSGVHNGKSSSTLLLYLLLGSTASNDMMLVTSGTTTRQQ
mmetsp:Transcript_28746/g.47576  ORF Transcript_28746/g.47576 Transcript_28746/m.47576 type:complete len:92 (+) Transcript_28746:380-655(+)